MILIISYASNWSIIAFDDLTTIKGMSWGVREDIQNGKRGLIPNWCSSPDSARVVWWEVIECPAN
jgi:hypothetical protein